MKCPYCESTENKVIDSRLNQTAEITRRRRQCLSCDGRFTTYERVEEVMPAIIKKDGRREPFSRDKIFSGIQKALQKRPITTQTVESTVSEIEKRVQSFSLKEIPARTIGQMIMIALHKLDKVAYVRFASVYREFKDVEEFVTELKDVPEENLSENKNLNFPFADHEFTVSPETESKKPPQP